MDVEKANDELLGDTGDIFKVRGVSGKLLNRVK